MYFVFLPCTWCRLRRNSSVRMLCLGSASAAVRICWDWACPEVFRSDAADCCVLSVRRETEIEPGWNPVPGQEGPERRAGGGGGSEAFLEKKDKKLID